MFPTKAVSSLKGFLPPIHQPLPLNRREAQLLLNTLTTSFRKNLDKEHGSLSDETAAPPSLFPALTPAKAARPRASSLPGRDRHHRPADCHLHAILSNPLFRCDSSELQSEGSTATVMANAGGGGGGSQRDPMDVFDEAVAKGMMTPAAAAGCLVAKKREIIEGAAPSVADAMVASAAARRVLAWLRASGQEADLAFLRDRKLVRALVPFMVVEGLEDTVWEWIRRLVAGERAAPAAPLAPRQVAADLLTRLIAEQKWLASPSLDTAFSSVLRAEDMFGSDRAFGDISVTPWRYVAWISTVDAWKLDRPSEKLFDAFSAVALNHFGNLRGMLQVDEAHLDLHHPTRPNCERALDYLETHADKPQWDVRLSQVHKLRLRVNWMALDLVKHLAPLGKHAEARWVLDLMRRKLGHEFEHDPEKGILVV